MDAQVQATQEWLNTTYRNRSGWVTLEQDGLIGWATVYGLRRALQAELGISPLSSGFGPATTTAFRTKFGSIKDDSVGENVIRLLSGALWCKGYTGLWAGAPVLFSSLSGVIQSLKRELGLAGTTPDVDVKLMASLLSMDAYRPLSGGSTSVRVAQQWLNGAYAHRRDFALIPTDGIYSRQIQTALLFGLQYEIGMADGTANGNFGAGTREGIRTKATVSTGSADGTRAFVRLFQAALRFNDFDVPFTGTFDDETAESVRRFQSFMELSSTGKGDYSTWCFLLVSSGDTDVRTSGFDTNVQLRSDEAFAAYAAGYRVAGRYTVGAGKYITALELRGLRASGLALVPLHQRFNNKADLMTPSNGRLHGAEAVTRARVLDLPEDTVIFFPVDFDALGETITGPVLDYFDGVKESIGRSLTRRYRVGVYGTRNVCSVVLDAGLAEAAYVAGISTGWSGNMGFRMPEAWHYNQIAELLDGELSTARAVKIDKVLVSSRATPVDLSSVVDPPTERDESPSATGFDAFFEWFVGARVACERALSEASSFLNPVANLAGALVDDHITHFLRLERYWGALWKGYTAVIETDSLAQQARAISEGALADHAAAVPLVSTRDIAHLAATLRGYEMWGVPTDPADYGLGDLGGWPLDLLQIWGGYVSAHAAGTADSLGPYLEAHLGRQTAAADAAGFGWGDLVADADAYLVAASKSEHRDGLEPALREVLQVGSATRLRRFHDVRFGGSTDNLVSSFAKVVDGIDVWEFQNVVFTKRLLLEAANAPGLPDADETVLLATHLSRVLTGG